MIRRLFDLVKRAAVEKKQYLKKKLRLRWQIFMMCQIYHVKCVRDTSTNWNLVYFLWVI